LKGSGTVRLHNDWKAQIIIAETGIGIPACDLERMMILAYIRQLLHPLHSVAFQKSH
jgi:hypothetical protein